jgi:hypothetical protein
MVNVTLAENQPRFKMDQDNPAVTTTIKNKKKVINQLPV